MKQAAYCLFETALGSCGIAWCERVGKPAVISLALPEAAHEITERRVAQISGTRQASAPPLEIAQVIERVRKHLEGEIQDFRDVVIDLEETDPFARQVYAAAREIPAGETRAYGEIAKELNTPDAARAVG